MDLKEVRWEGLDWIHLVQDRRHWWANVGVVMSFWDPGMLGISWTVERQVGSQEAPSAVLVSHPDSYLDSSDSDWLLWQTTQEFQRMKSIILCLKHVCVCANIRHWWKSLCYH
jgi:hypothetical protein